ncbi:MAG: hydroxyisourate hydrolase [Bosea sp. (in: a-proteobacteria)]
MGRLSTHVLDTVAGGPASGVRIVLERLMPVGGRHRITEAITNADGRTDAPLLAGEAMQAGSYELTFHIGEYFRARGHKLSEPPFLDVVPIRFQIADANGHYHVPLLASPHAYSTYRGS